jgi:K+-sensing histidine kinase KdpD
MTEPNLEHKLLEPLAVILGHVGILLDGLVGELTADQKQRLTTIKENAEKLNRNIRAHLEGSL